MATRDSLTPLENGPQWWSETVLGLGIVLAGTTMMVGGPIAASKGIAALTGAASSTYVVETVAGVAVAQLLLAALYVVVGYGGTYAYLTRRAFEPGFVLERPDQDTTRLLAGLLGFAVVLVWGGTLVPSLWRGGFDGVVLQVAPVFLGATSAMPAASIDGASLLLMPLGVLLFAGVVGPALGVLFHGVLQNSLRRVVPSTVAIAGTAVVVPIGAGAPSGLLGPLLLAVFAVAVGYGYERTENLAVPILAYAGLNAFTLTTGLVFVLSAMGTI